MYLGKRGIFFFYLEEISSGSRLIIYDPVFRCSRVKFARMRVHMYDFRIFSITSSRCTSRLSGKTRRHPTEWIRTSDRVLPHDSPRFIKRLFRVSRVARPEDRVYNNVISRPSHESKGKRSMDRRVNDQLGTVSSLFLSGLARPMGGQIPSPASDLHALTPLITPTPVNYEACSIAHAEIV